MQYLKRWATQALETRLNVMPAVIVTGARQIGKSTLVNHLLTGERQYYSLDDLDIAEQAARNPSALTSGSMPITIDEIQRVPALLHEVKRSIDADRTPGRFLLTGSANLLLMQRVSESLAGRAAYMTLRPLSRGEQDRRNAPSLWSGLLETRPSELLGLINSSSFDRADWSDLTVRGGFPVPAIELKDREARGIWFDGYVRTYLERDLLELSSVASLPDFRRLMRIVAARVGQIANQSELGRTVGLKQPTVHRYLNLMETSYMLIRLPAYAVNRTKRLVKSPKLFWGDTGLGMHLSGQSVPEGNHFENFILNDIMASRDAGESIDEIYYWRTTDGTEVDFVLESGDTLLPIEVKSTARPRLRDCKGLEVFLEEYPSTSRCGILLHTGENVQWLTPRVLAVPWWKLM